MDGFLNPLMCFFLARKRWPITLGETEAGKNAWLVGRASVEYSEFRCRPDDSVASNRRIRRVNFVPRKEYVVGLKSGLRKQNTIVSSYQRPLIMIRTITTIPIILWPSLRIISKSVDYLSRPITLLLLSLFLHPRGNTAWT